MKGNRLAKLCDILNLKEFTLIDVGASGGIDRRWHLLGNRLFVIGFEPGEKEFQSLVERKEHKNIKYYNYCLAKETRQLKFFVYKNNRNASCLMPNYQFLNRFPMCERFNLMNEVYVNADTLDNTALAKKADFIKIDTEGYELEVLNGGAEVLRNVCGLEVEVEFCGLHKEQPLFAEVDTYLRGLGFSLFDLRPAYWKRNLRRQSGRGQIIFADALYFKDYISIGAVATNSAAIIVAALLYKKYDFALEMINYFYQKGQLGLEVKEKAESVIMDLSKPFLRIPDFKGRNRIISILTTLLGALKSVNWARYESWE